MKIVFQKTFQKHLKKGGEKLKQASSISRNINTPVSL